MVSARDGAVPPLGADTQRAFRARRWARLPSIVFISPLWQSIRTAVPAPRRRRFVETAGGRRRRRAGRGQSVGVEHAEAISRRRAPCTTRCGSCTTRRSPEPWTRAIASILPASEAADSGRDRLAAEKCLAIRASSPRRDPDPRSTALSPATTSIPSSRQPLHDRPHLPPDRRDERCASRPPSVDRCLRDEARAAPSGSAATDRRRHSRPRRRPRTRVPHPQQHLECGRAPPPGSLSRAVGAGDEAHPARIALSCSIPGSCATCPPSRSRNR